MSRVFVGVLVAFATACCGVITETVQAQGANPACARAKALLAAGETARAHREYVRVLVNNPSAKCANRALRHMNEQSEGESKSACDSGDSAFDLGDLAAAQKAYKTLPPEAECRVSGLTAIRQVKQLCAQGQAQRKAHRTKEALASFNAALAKSPTTECATSGISETESEVASRLQSAAITTVQVAAVALGIVAIVVFIGLCLGYIKPVRRFMFFFPIIGRILGPRLTMEPFDDVAVKDLKLGAPMAAQMKERLERLRNESKQIDWAGYDLDLGDTGEQFSTLVSDNGAVRNAIDKAKDISGQGAIVASVLAFLYAILPIRRFGVSAVLGPLDRSGAAATLSFEDNGRIAAAVHLTGPPLSADPTAGDYLELVDPAAVWLQYEVARALKDSARLRRKATAHAAESFALVRKGLDLHLAHDDLEARKAYENAIELDPQNWAARFNLAMLEARTLNYAVAVEMLQAALDDLKQTSRS